MATRTLVLVDAGMVAGYRRAVPSIAQLHQAVVHLHRQHPEAWVALVADPTLKWDLAPEEQERFDADITAQVIVCAPAGAMDGTHGFLARSAARARELDYEVVAVTDRAVPGVALGRLRNDGGRWRWDLDDTTTVAADAAPSPRRRARRRR